jgi:hypothetical protein
MQRETAIFSPILSLIRNSKLIISVPLYYSKTFNGLRERTEANSFLFRLKKITKKDYSLLLPLVFSDHTERILLLAYAFHVQRENTISSRCVIQTVYCKCALSALRA